MAKGRQHLILFAIFVLSIEFTSGSVVKSSEEDDSRDSGWGWQPELHIAAPAGIAGTASVAPIASPATIPQIAPVVSPAMGNPNPPVANPPPNPQSAPNAPSPPAPGWAPSPPSPPQVGWSSGSGWRQH